MNKYCLMSLLSRVDALLLSRPRNFSRTNPLSCVCSVLLKQRLAPFPFAAIYKLRETRRDGSTWPASGCKTSRKNKIAGCSAHREGSTPKLQDSPCDGLERNPKSQEAPRDAFAGGLQCLGVPPTGFAGSQQWSTYSQHQSTHSQHTINIQSARQSAQAFSLIFSGFGLNEHYKSSILLLKREGRCIQDMFLEVP